MFNGPSPSPSPLETASDGGFDIASLIGPALIAATVAGLVSLIQIYVTGRRDRSTRRLEFRLRQINGYYGPLTLMLAETLTLGKTLRESAQTDTTVRWNLLDHVNDVRSDPHLLAIAARIVAVNEEIKGLLMTQGGLSLEAPWPACYTDWLTHAQQVARAVETGSLPNNVERKYFPREFEDRIKGQHQALVQEIAGEMGK